MGKSTRLLSDWVVDRFVNLELFNRKQQAMPNGCIEWTGVKNNIGYGFVGFNYAPGTTSPSGHRSGMMTAHRLAFMIHNNRMPTKRNVNHTCHNKLCVNPAHLTEGTQREKLNAMMAAGIKGGRQLGQSGYAYNHEQYGREYKYSIEEIQWIRTASSDAIAERYGISKLRASSRRWTFRKVYAWLPLPEGEQQKQKPGRKPKTSK